MRPPPVFLCGPLILCWMSSGTMGQEPVRNEPIQVAEATGTSPSPSLGADAWAEIIRATVISSMPEKSVQDKHWGHTTAVLSRYEIKTRHGRISMRPKTKQVNHGLWQRQTISMLKPNETLQIEFRNIQRPPDGALTFTMQVVMRSRVTTEFAHWLYGVKGLNGQVEADVTIAAVVDCSIDLTSEQQAGELLPSIQLVPDVQDLQLKVTDIDARQIGLVGGWAAEEIGDSSRSTVNSILHGSEGKILKDLRRKIEKNQDRLRISPSQLLTGSKPRTGDSKPK